MTKALKLSTLFCSNVEGIFALVLVNLSFFHILRHPLYIKRGEGLVWQKIFHNRSTNRSAFCTLR